jgi:hypothetical protein
MARPLSFVLMPFGRTPGQGGARSRFPWRPGAGQVAAAPALGFAN